MYENKSDLIIITDEEMSSALAAVDAYGSTIGQMTTILNELTLLPKIEQGEPLDEQDIETVCIGLRLLLGTDRLRPFEEPDAEELGFQIASEHERPPIEALYHRIYNAIPIISKARIEGFFDDQLRREVLAADKARNAARRRE